LSPLDHHFGDSVLSRDYHNQSAILLGEAAGHAVHLRVWVAQSPVTVSARCHKRHGTRI
jgi:hypothetical protein